MSDVIVFVQGLMEFLWGLLVSPLCVAIELIAAQCVIAKFLIWRNSSQYTAEIVVPKEDRITRVPKDAKILPSKEMIGEKTEDEKPSEARFPGSFSGILILLSINCVLYVCVMIVGPNWLPHKLHLHWSLQAAAIVFIVHYLTHGGKRFLAKEIYFPSDEFWMGVVFLLHIGGYFCFIQTLDRVSTLLHT